MKAEQPEQIDNISLLKSGKIQEPEMIIRFVSLHDKRQVEGIDDITEILTQKEFKVDHFEYKVTVKTEIRKLINPKFKDGPTEKVMIEERLDVNSHLKTVGQLNWRIMKDPENVLLVELSRAKGEPFCLTLIFAKVFKSYRQIVATGMNSLVRLQLLTKPDLKFEQIPKIVEENPLLKEQFLNRAQRLKGMQATARELMDVSGLPEEIEKKISKIATGQKVPMTDAENVNLILLSDVNSRYSTMLQTFQDDVVSKKGSVAALARQFSELTQNISPRYIVSKLRELFDDQEDIPSKNNAQVFSYIFSQLQKMDEKKFIVNNQPLTRASVFNLLRSLIIVARSQFDPDLWNKCLFFLNPEDEGTDQEANRKAIELLAEDTRKLLISHVESQSKSLLEIYLANNIHTYVAGKTVRLSKRHIDPMDFGVYKNVLLPYLKMKQPKDPKQKGVMTIYGEDYPTQRLINPLHCIARCYGYLIGYILKENVQRFMQPGLRNLLNRFGRNFFDIFYEKAVTDSGLPISRNQFAQWLTINKLVFKLGEKGYIQNTLESDFDPYLTPQILSGNGESIFPMTFSEDDFYKAYREQRDKFLQFIEQVRKHAKAKEGADDDDHNPGKIFLELIEKGIYNFLSSNFRNRMKRTFLFEELNEVVVNSCSEFRQALEQEAVNRKIVLKVPLKFASALYIGQTFDVSTGNQVIQVFVLPVPVKSVEDLKGLSKKFSINFALHLQQNNSSERKGLIQAVNILREYQKISIEFFRYSSIFVLDRVVHRSLLKLASQEKRTPAHIKHYFSDDDKLLIGNVKDLKLGKLLLQAINPRTRKVKDAENQSIAQLLQSIYYYKSSTQNLAVRRKIITQIIGLLDRFSPKLKEREEWKRYHRMLTKFGEVIKLPINELDDQKLKLLTAISMELKKMKNTSKLDGTVSTLYNEWRRRFPKNERGIDFYTPFMDQEISNKDNLLLELRNARDSVIRLQQKRCLIFFPEISKTFQIGHMVEIGRFFQEKSFKLNIYVETTSLDEDKIDLLSKVFYPDHFFKISLLEPEKPTPKTASG